MMDLTKESVVSNQTKTQSMFTDDHGNQLQKNSAAYVNQGYRGRCRRKDSLLAIMKTPRRRDGGVSLGNFLVSTSKPPSKGGSRNLHSRDCGVLKTLIKTLFLFLSVLFLLFLNPSYSAGSTTDCQGLLGDWDSNCLMQEVRSNSYYGISTTDISDDLLRQYIDQHQKDIAALLLEIDFGNRAQLFLNGSTNSIDTEEMHFIDAAKEQWNVSLNFMMGQMVDAMTSIANKILENNAIELLGDIQGVVSTINEGYEAYKKAQVVLTAKEIRFLLGVYCQDRAQGKTPAAAWSDVYNADYQPLWDLISNIKGVPATVFFQKFENVYTAYRLVGYSDSQDIRIRHGRAIVDIAAPQTIAPIINQNPASGPAGTTFSQWGDSFSRWKSATLHFRKPDGTEYPTQTVDIDESGHFQVTYYAPPNKQPGTYTWWAIDDKTGIQSNEFLYDIGTAAFGPFIWQSPIGGPPGTTFTQWGVGFTPDHDVTLHFLKPDLTEYPTQTVHTDSAGYFSITYTAPSNKPQGTYTWWGVDDSTNVQSNSVSYQITNDSPGTVFIQGHTVAYDETWLSGGTYIVQGSITVEQDATLTIQSGAIVKLGSGVSIDVNGTLTATGVIFTWADGVTEWQGIHFHGAGSSGSRVENCTFEHTADYAYWHVVNTNNIYEAKGVVWIDNASPTVMGNTIGNGSATYGIVIENSSPVISNNTISGRSNTGIYVSNGSSPTVSSNTLTGNQNGVYIASDSSGSYQGNTISGSSYGIRANYGSNNPLFNGNTYSGNTGADLWVEGTISTAVTWDEAGTINYQTPGLSIPVGTSLSIASGRTVKFDPGAGIEVAGTLTATGVIFTWADGVTEWQGIHFHGAGSSGSRVENCTFEHTADYAYWHVVNTNNIYEAKGVVWIDNASPTVMGNTIGNGSATYGIVIENSSPVISNNTISGRSNTGIYVSNGSSPTVSSNMLTGNQNGVYIASDSSGSYQGNTISGNTFYGLYYSGIGMLNATSNNWGDPSGPLDDSDDRATGGLFNPNGLGNKVSDHVNYYPWTGMISIGATAVPTGFDGISISGGVNLTWNANVEPYLGGYKVYYGTASGNYGTPKIVGVTNTIQLTGLSNGIGYYISISSMNIIGAESAKSAEIMIMPGYNKLTITKTGSSQGSVTASGGTIGWSGNTGEAYYSTGTKVDLTATDALSEFTWSGACNGNANPCSVTMDIDRNVSVTFSSKANFTVNQTTGQAPLFVSFTDSSTNIPTSWLWDFGDSGASVLKNPMHTFKAPGTYDVTLTATGSGISPSVTKTITVSSCPNSPVLIAGYPYNKIQDAYLVAGNDEVVKIQALDFSEDLNLQHSTTVTLNGGYGCDFTANPSNSTLYGKVTISDGTVTLENIIIK